MRAVSIQMSHFFVTLISFSSTCREHVMMFVKGFKRVLLIQYIRLHTVTVITKNESPEKRLFVRQNLYSKM